MHYTKNITGLNYYVKTAISYLTTNFLPLQI